MSEPIVTDNYGTVTRDTYAFLTANNITPAEWDELIEVFGSDHEAARATITEHTTDGMYNSWQAMQALQS